MLQWASKWESALEHEDETTSIINTEAVGARPDPKLLWQEIQANV